MARTSTMDMHSRKSAGGTFDAADRPRLRRSASPRGKSLARLSWLLLLGHLGAGAPVPAEEGAATPGPRVEETTAFALSDARPAAWYEPPVIRPVAGETVDLYVTTTRERGLTPQVQTPKGPVAVDLRSYFSPQAKGSPSNGLVGPTIRVKAGDVLRLNLHNQLPPNRGECDPKAHHPPQCFDYTNLHTHGLHISPAGTSDNVLISVAPQRDGGERAAGCGELSDCHAGLFRHELKILPARDRGVEPGGRHHPGTSWYHAHRHGSTAVQLASGMAGALIVEDPNEIPQLRGVRERVMVMQQLAFDAKGVVDVKKVTDLRKNWELGRYTTINGVAKPGIPMCPGEVQRWRIIDGGVFEVVPIDLAVVERAGGRWIPYSETQQIAIDGITMEAPQRYTGGGIEMGPGYRVDLLVKAPERLPSDKALVLRKLPSSLLFAGMTQEPQPQFLAEVVLENPDSAICRSVRVRDLLPRDALRSPFPKITEDEVKGTRLREVRFRVTEGGEFQINERDFSHHVHEDFQLRLGCAEEWRLSTSSADRGPHPFHIHVNAFQMIRDGKPAEWRDTILVPPQGETLTMRTRYERFEGTFVLHCHILHHEDLGMMQLVRIDQAAHCRDPEEAAEARPASTLPEYRQ